MKKRFCTFLVAVAATGLAACGGGGGGGATGCTVPSGLLSKAVGKFADEYWMCESAEAPIVSISFYFVKDGTGDSDVMGNLKWSGEDDGTGVCGPDYSVKAKNSTYGTFTMADVALSGDTLTFTMQSDFTFGPDTYPVLTMTCARTKGS